MTKEQKDLAWACLPKEARDQIRGIVKTSGMGIHGMFDLVFGGNVTSDTEPEEILTTSVKKVVERVRYLKSYPKEYSVNEANAIVSELLSFFGDKCLPDKESSVQAEPKKFFESDYSIGDKVIVCISSIGEPRKEVVTLIRQYQPQCDYNDYAKTWLIQTQDGQTFQSNEEHFEPYTEENKETQEEKELNLCELLKGCEGEKLYTTPYGELVFREMDQDFITLGWDRACGVVMYHINGRLHSTADVVTIFPSRALYEKYPLDAYSAWMEWKETRKPKRWRAKLGEKYWVVDIELSHTWSEEKNDGYDKVRYNNGNYFRTEEEAQQAAEAVRETLAKLYEQKPT